MEHKIDFKRVHIGGQPRQIWRFKCPKCEREQVLNGETLHLVTIVDGIVTIEPGLTCAYHIDTLRQMYKRTGTNPPEGWEKGACTWAATVRNGKCLVSKRN